MKNKSEVLIDLCHELTYAITEYTEASIAGRSPRIRERDAVTRAIVAIAAHLDPPAAPAPAFVPLAPPPPASPRMVGPFDVECGHPEHYSPSHRRACVEGKGLYGTPIREAAAPPAPLVPLPPCTNCGHLLGMHTSSTVGHCLAWRCACTEFGEAGRSSDTRAPGSAAGIKGPWGND